MDKNHHAIFRRRLHYINFSLRLRRSFFFYYLNPSYWIVIYMWVHNNVRGGTIFSRKAQKTCFFASSCVRLFLKVSVRSRLKSHSYTQLSAWTRTRVSIRIFLQHACVRGNPSRNICQRELPRDVVRRGRAISPRRRAKLTHFAYAVPQLPEILQREMKKAEMRNLSRDDLTQLS